MTRTLNEQEQKLWLKHHRRYMKRVRKAGAKPPAPPAPAAPEGKWVDPERKARFLRTIELTRLKPPPVVKNTYPSDLMPAQQSPLTDAEIAAAKATAHLTSLPVPDPEPIP